MSLYFPILLDSRQSFQASRWEGRRKRSAQHGRTASDGLANDWLEKITIMAFLSSFPHFLSKEREFAA